MGSLIPFCLLLTISLCQSSVHSGSSSVNTQMNSVFRTPLESNRSPMDKYEGLHTWYTAPQKVSCVKTTPKTHAHLIHLKLGRTTKPLLKSVLPSSQLSVSCISAFGAKWLLKLCKEVIQRWQPDTVMKSSPHNCMSFSCPVTLQQCVILLCNGRVEPELSLN